VSKWCTVTVTDANGERHSLDVLAQSTYDAAHLYVTSAKSQHAAMLAAPLPVPTTSTTFEVVTEGRVFRVGGAALQQWIAKRRQELGGPKGQLFRQRPQIE
jgi:hypothetical protein